MSTAHSRRGRVLAAAIIVGTSLVVIPAISATAQADTYPLWLETTWDLYDYQNSHGAPLYGETDTLNSDAATLASQYAACPQTNCLYLIPTLPGSSHTSLYFVKMGWRGLPSGEPQALANAVTATSAGTTLLNAYYNYGGFGTYTKGDFVYAVLIMTHYTTPPQ